MENNLTKIRKLEKQLTAAVFLFFILIIGFLVMYDSDSKEALAITGNYSKGATAELTADDWNKLDDDFVAKGGDATLGNLNLNAVLNHSVDSPFYINSDDGLQLRVNSNGGVSDFGINGSANTRLFTMDNSGNVGISGNLRTGGNDDGSSWNVGINGPVIQRAGTVLLGIDSGNVGIGTDNPLAKLDVAGDIAVNGRSYIKVGSVNHGAGSNYEKQGKDILDLKPIVGSLENAKKCLVFVVAADPEYNSDYKTFCRVDSNGFIDAALAQDGTGPYDGIITCGYICSATTDQNVVYY